MTPTKKESMLHVTCKRDTLQKQIAAVLPFVAQKTTIPILANLLFTATDNTLTVQGTDLDTSLRSRFEVKVKSEGTITIPARKLSDTLKKLASMTEPEITIQVLENNWIELTCGKFKVKLPGMAATSYPVIARTPEGPTAKPLNIITASALSGLISRTRFAMAEEESRYTLNGALLLINGQGVTMVATDRHRLSCVLRPGSVGGPDVKVLINKECIDKLQGLLVKEPKPPNDGLVEVATDDSNVFFSLGDREVSSRIMTGQFPNYEQVLPKNYSSQDSVALDAKVLAQVVERMAQFANERIRSVKFSLEPGKPMQLSASNTESGEASETVDVHYTGKPITTAFQANYVLDYLKTVNGDGVRITFRGAQSAVLFTPMDGGGYECRTVIMPVRA